MEVTSVITLGTIQPEDESAMLDILTNDTVKQTYMLPDFESRDAAVRLFRKLMLMSLCPDFYVRGIYKNKRLIGMINHTEMDSDSMELGYVLHPDYHNRGYMTQALQTAIEELFQLGYRTVITGAFETNLPSIRVMEKCGMKKTEKTDTIPYRGKTHLCVYYKIEKQE